MFHGSYFQRNNLLRVLFHRRLCITGTVFHRRLCFTGTVFHRRLCFTGGCVSREGAHSQSLQMKASRVRRGKQGQSSAVQICRLLTQAFLFRDFLPLFGLDIFKCVKCSTRKWLQKATYRSLFLLSFGFGSRLAAAPPRICPNLPSLQKSLHISEKHSV